MGSQGRGVQRAISLAGLVAVVLLSLVTDAAATPPTKLFLTKVIQKVDTICIGSATAVKNNGKPKSKPWKKNKKGNDKSLTIDKADVLLVGNAGDIDDQTTKCVASIEKKLYAPGLDTFYTLSDDNTPAEVLYSSWRVQMLPNTIPQTTPVQVNVTNAAHKSVFVKGPDVEIAGTNAVTSFDAVQPVVFSAVAANFTNANFASMDMITAYLYQLDRSQYDSTNTYGAILVMPDYDVTDESSQLYWTTAYLNFRPVAKDRFEFKMFEASYSDTAPSPPTGGRRLKGLPTYYYYTSSGSSGVTTTSTGCTRGFCQLKINGPTNCSPYPRCRYTCTCTQGA